MGTQTQRLSSPWARHKGIQWSGGTAPHNALPHHFMQVSDQFYSPASLPLGPRPSPDISKEEINLSTLLGIKS
jgi:hypothetical protein